MFFGKKDKPASSSRPVRVTILTDEYIIDALDDPDLSILHAAFDSDPTEPTGGTIILKDARLQALGKMETPARTFAEWRMPSFVKVIAIISDDPTAENLILQGWEDYQTPFKACIYAGAFTIEGTIYSEDEEPPDFALHTFTPLENAIITYQLDKKEKAIGGRWGVVNSVLMHGFSIEK